MSLTRIQLKNKNRQVIKAVAGGPTDRTRGAGLIDLLDDYADASLLDEDLGAGVVVRAWSATIDDWQQEEYATARVGGVEGHYRAKLAGGPFPAPTGLDDTYWRQVAPPRGALVQHQAIPLALAQMMPGDDAVGTIRYTILRPGGNIEVFGLPADPVNNLNSRFSPQGWWLDPSDGVSKWVDYDVATDAVTPVASGGPSYTDAQARAAQLNQVDTSGAAIVTFTESRFLPPVTAGTRVFDPAGAVPGVWLAVTFDIAGGASAPDLSDPAFVQAGSGEFEGVCSVMFAVFPDFIEYCLNVHP